MNDMNEEQFEGILFPGGRNRFSGQCIRGIDGYKTDEDICLFCLLYIPENLN